MTLVTLKSFFKKIDGLDRTLGIVFLFGAIVAFVSLFRGILVDRQVQIEYLNESVNETSDPQNKILVDVEGAVMFPGVYSLSENSRIKDLLVLAGGYSEKADRTYCEKNLNLAQPLKDGQKIYVPEVSNTPGIPGYVEAKNTLNSVNVNSASSSELDTLWGVGAARAETIVKNRPYSSFEELVSKGGMTKQIAEKNKDKIVFY